MNVYLKLDWDFKEVLVIDTLELDACLFKDLKSTRLFLIAYSLKLEDDVLLKKDSFFTCKVVFKFYLDLVLFNVFVPIEEVVHLISI